MRKAGTHFLLLGLTLLLNLIIFVSIPFLSRITEMQPAYEISGSPTLVRLPEPEPSRQQPLRPRQKLKAPGPPRLATRLDSLPVFEISPPPRPEADLKMPEPEFEVPPIELGRRKIPKPAQEKPKPASKQVQAAPKPAQPAPSEAEPHRASRSETPAPARPKPSRKVPAAYSLNEVDQRPRLLKKMAPVYPYKAKRSNISGLVVLRFLVDKTGQVRQVTVQSADPAGVFEENVLEAVRQWRFRPGKVQGKVVKTWVEVPIRFEIEE